MLVRWRSSVVKVDDFSQYRMRLVLTRDRLRSWRPAIADKEARSYLRYSKIRDLRGFIGIGGTYGSISYYVDGFPFALIL